MTILPIHPCVRRTLRGALAAILLLTFSRSSHAEWGEKSQLSSKDVQASLNENMGHCLIAQDSTLYAVWTEKKDADSAIHFRRSTDRGATWSAAVRISPVSGFDSNPLLAQSGTTLHLVFVRKAGTPEAASHYKRSTDDGRTWEPDVLLGKTKWWPGVAAAGSMVYVSLNTVHDDDPKSSIVRFRRSTDDGKTWEEPIAISTAPRRVRGRAEDPAIMASGKQVQLVWNDNRDFTPGKGMAVYSRRSSDMGKTWSEETALTRGPEYTYFPSIHLSGTHADLVYGDRQSGHYDIFRMHSSDLGATWSPREQVTNTPGDEFYPAIVRDGSNVHMTWFAKDGISYLRSRDGGKSWAPAVVLNPAGTMPFLATAGDAVYVLFTSRQDGRMVVFVQCDPVGNQTAPATNKTP
jgi:hypothetical protein